MQRIYKGIFIIFTLLFSSNLVSAQDGSVSVDPALLGIFNAKTPKEYTIADITVTGTKAFDANLIISISGLAVGDKVIIPGTDVFSKAITKLWRQNLISDVEISFTKLEGTNLYVQIDVKERPRLASYKFVGIKKGEKDDLEPKMALTKDRVVTENMKLSAIEVIRKFYYGKGFRNVDIQLTEEQVPGMNNAIALTFYIKKGHKVKVNSINFSGNENIAAQKLKKQMKGTKEMNRITLFPITVKNPFGDTESKQTFKDYIKDVGFMSLTKTRDYVDPYFRIRGFSGAKFNENKYIEDKEHVLDYYNSRGYRDAVILNDTAIMDQRNNLNLFLKVSEGRQYYFGNIVWRGNTKYSDSVLNSILGIKKGDIYNLDLLNKKIGKQLSAEGLDIGSLYMDDGYLFFQVDPVETAVYNDTIDFELRMREGPQATYGNITISGNKKTKDYVIRRELRTIPGEKFSRQDIIRTQRELGQLGFIDPEKINPQINPNAENGTVDINWGVEEKSGDQLELSAGFGGGIGLTGTLGVSFNNFSIKNITKRSTWDPLPSGDGQKFSARIQSNGKAFRSYNFSFTEPWLGGKKRNSFTIAYSNTKYANAYDVFGQYCKSCGDTSYVKATNFDISLGKQLKWPDDYFNLIYAINVQRYKLRNYSLFGSSEELRNTTSTNISLRLALIRNSAGPNPIFPTSGSNFLLSGQFTLPYSLLGITSNSTNSYKLPEFHKWRMNAEWYVPIGLAKGEEKNKQFILKVAAKYGFIGRYNKNLSITPFGRFQLGDAGLSNNFALLGYDIIAHRGYPVYETSNPRINPEDITPAQFFTIFNKYTVELRYPFSTSASSTIYGLAFFEAANGWYDFKSYNPFKLRRSAGLGLRFFLPMFGLLGFDYGIGFDRYTPTSGFKGAAKFTFMLGQEPE
ncbi:MAG: outer membrane protein assembly factor [Ferruginibacter sp.]|nr:outer membrane protein assembly factor [Bacteroidota bacterium]MBX2917680.1 outer membrane protein assembly factor [Ferruginibacter sp.]MCB0707836.1 outer membrane protein assembly factor [Chitinophagaceae bacterium]